MEQLNSFVTGMNGYKYPIVLGENYYCVPTCLKIILSSIGSCYEVEELASYFTVITPQCSTCNNDLGVHINNGDLNRIFNKLGIPLYEEFIPLNTIPDFEFTDLLQSLLSQKTHIICGYSYGYLFSEKTLLDVGHTSVILSSDDDYIQILNPGPNYVGINKVREYSLYNAIRRKRDGLWVIRRK